MAVADIDPDGPPFDEPRARAVLDAMSDGVYVVDRERRITYWNAGAQAMTGHTVGEVVGRWCGDGLLNHVDEYGQSMCGEQCPLAATILDGATREAAAYLHRADGRLLPVTLKATPLRDADGVIVGAIETFVDDTDVVAARERIAELERLALLDPLTGVGNRRHLDRCFERRMSDLARHGVPFGAVMVDIDHFKCVNDAHGHETGDRVIERVAETILLAVRAGDDVARYGGEEFVVLTSHVEGDQLAALAERLRSFVAETVVHVPDAQVRVTVSIGAAATEPGDTATALLARADARMQRAKLAGRNRTVAT